MMIMWKSSGREVVRKSSCSLKRRHVMMAVEMRRRHQMSWMKRLTLVMRNMMTMMMRNMTIHDGVSWAVLFHPGMMAH